MDPHKIAQERWGNIKAPKVTRISAPCNLPWGSFDCALFERHLVPDASQMLNCSVSDSSPFSLNKKREKKEE